MVSGGMIFIGLTLLLVQVIMRYFLGMSTTWQDEAARYFIIWGVLLGSTVAIRDNQHIKVDIFYQLFNELGRKIINLISNFFVLLFLIILIVYGFLLVKDKFLTGQNSHIGVELYFIYLILPLSGIFMAIRTIEKIVRFNKILD